MKPVIQQEIVHLIAVSDDQMRTDNGTDAGGPMAWDNWSTDLREQFLSEVEEITGELSKHACITINAAHRLRGLYLYIGLPSAVEHARRMEEEITIDLERLEAAMRELQQKHLKRT